MTEPSWDDRDLTAVLRDVGRRLDAPDGVDVDAVLRRIEAEESLARTRFPRGWRAVLAAAVLLMIAGTAIAGGLNVAGVEIVFAPDAPRTPVGTDLRLGTPTTLDEAGDSLDFAALVPAADLPEPDVYVARDVRGGRLSLVYPATDDLPETTDGVGLLLMEFEGELAREFLSKTLGDENRAVETDVNGTPALWIEGEHVLLYRVGGGTTEERSRVAGNVLLWRDGDVTLRLESALDLEQARRIAQSVDQSID